ncbi:MAG: peroxidase, partial [Cyanothece sp. SIO1E1]|nr:peroxidase [Cyanothece sp. SIO1E1]
MALTEADLREIPEDGIDPENPAQYQALLADLQGNILKGHGREHSVHLFLQFKPAQMGTVKQWIQQFAHTYVTSAKQQAKEALQYQQAGVPGPVFANFFLSRRGYEYLEIEPFQIPSDQPFRMGMSHDEIRSALNDPKPETWEEGFQHEIHALVLMADDDVVALTQTVNQMIRDLQQVAEILHREDGFVLRNGAGQAIEHFGFVDGISQPLFLKRDIAKAQINGCDFNQWDPRASLDIILVKDPNGRTDDSYGSYAVYRKLEQNVKAFRQDQRKLAETLSINDDLAGALVVGRFYDGTPVSDSDIPLDAATPTNNFNYDADPQASKCPFHTHIRKANPRGDTGRVESSPGFDDALAVEKKHRIARRAISYGENDVKQEPTAGSGLLFLCFQSDIENQFNFMQSRWCNAPNFVQVNVGTDPLVGQRGNQPEQPQKWPPKWGESETVDYAFELW